MFQMKVVNLDKVFYILRHVPVCLNRFGEKSTIDMSFMHVGVIFDRYEPKLNVVNNF
jgi:hypothetical protein